MTTKALTLEDFLLARIAEDEKGLTIEPRANDVPHMVGFWHGKARFLVASPSRVERECAAKRRLVALHAGDQPYCSINFSNADHDYFEGACDNLRALALPYADHPDFRPEWRI